MVNASSCLVVKSNNLAFSAPFLQPALLIIQPCTLNRQKFQKCSKQVSKKFPKKVPKKSQKSFKKPTLLIIQPCTLDSQHGGTKQLKPKFDFRSIYDKKATIVVLFYDFFQVLTLICKVLKRTLSDIKCFHFLTCIFAN